MSQSARTRRPTENHLAGQKSPYLLQHAHNPVDWHPWGQEAFERARREDKPIFLSIGYSTCHWCHVMERESFEDEAIAEALNQHFVSIKVDREERPDVDRVYMAYVQAVSGRGGWPLSVWLTPELKPFAGGTYFPPRSKSGMPGFDAITAQIHAAWEGQRQDIARVSSATMEQLAQLGEPDDDVPLPRAADVLKAGFVALEAAYDAPHGGFGAAPKFPRPAAFNLLLRCFARTQDDRPAEMVLHTLREMARGGIHDHLGGGFHRYSVDRYWHVPHFEKMLYDQAQLAKSYLEAYQLRADVHFAEVARGIFDYVLRDLREPDTGAFCSAEDADSAVSEGGPSREGAFYVWTRQQIDEVLGEHAAVFVAHYGVVDEGNAMDPHGELLGKNVLHVAATLEQTATRFGCNMPQLKQRLLVSSEALLACRHGRPRPLRDDKVLCGWNGMMISALSRGFAVLGEARYLEAARSVAHWVTRSLYDSQEDLLYRRYRRGERAVPAYVEDYAQLVEGLLDLYESDLDLRWLDWAETLTRRQDELFFDEARGGYFASYASDDSVLLRLKDDYDGAEPAASSVAASNLLRLAALLDRPEWQQRAEATIRYFTDRLCRSPTVMPQMVVALDMLDNPPARVVLVGQREDPRVQQALRVLAQPFLPNKVVLLADEALVEAHGERMTDVAAMRQLDGQPTFYVCRGRTCDAPTVDVQAVLRALRAS